MKLPEEKKSSPALMKLDWSLGTGEGEVCREEEGEMYAWTMEEWKQNRLLSHSVEESVAWHRKFKKNL